MRLRRLLSAIVLVATWAPGIRARADEPPPFTMRNPTLEEMLTAARTRGVPILVHVLSEH